MQLQAHGYIIIRGYYLRMCVQVPELCPTPEGVCEAQALVDEAQRVVEEVLAGHFGVHGGEEG